METAKEYRVIIAGGRDYHDYEFVKFKLSLVFRNLDFSNLEIVSGGAKGTDFLGERWAKENGVQLRIFPADWAKHKNAAGPIRNKQMAEYGTHLVAFWDGHSRGTQNMIQTAESLGLTTRVFRYD